MHRILVIVERNSIKMEDGDVDLSTQFLLSNNEMDEYLRSISTCTHTHTCNPPGPNVAGHTHTCYHTHTRVFTSGDDEETEGEEEKPKRSRKPLGNKEAVRKYREKKKAHTAYLEEEVKKLRLTNQQLIRKLQGQAALQAEVVRLRVLLADIRGKIDGELGMFPFHKQCSGTSFQCDTGVPCIGVRNQGMVGWDGSCEPAIVDCQLDESGNLNRNSNVEVTKTMGMMASLL